MDSFFARNRLSAYLDRTLPKTEAEAISEAILASTKAITLPSREGATIER